MRDIFMDSAMYYSHDVIVVMYDYDGHLISWCYETYDYIYMTYMFCYLLCSIIFVSCYKYFGNDHKMLELDNNGYKGLWRCL